MLKESEATFVEICLNCGCDKFHFSEGVIYYYLTCDKCRFSKIFIKSDKTIKEEKCNN